MSRSLCPLSVPQPALQLIASPPLADVAGQVLRYSYGFDAQIPRIWAKVIASEERCSVCRRDVDPFLICGFGLAGMTVVVKELLVCSDVFNRHASTYECSRRGNEIALLWVGNVEIGFIADG